MIIDENEVLERLAGNKDLLQLLMTKFLDDYENIQADIQKMNNGTSGDEIQRYVHSIKGAAANLAMHELSKLAKSLEEKLRREEVLTERDILQLDTEIQAVKLASKSLFD
jgi:HPt (histidine-containing phosphotransfer) domain-containing protein